MAINKNIDGFFDVIKETGAKKNPECKKNNPLGTCCHGIIKDAIEQAKQMGPNLANDSTMA